MRIKDLLSELNQTDVKSIHQDMNLYEAARTLSTFRIGALPVVDQQAKIAGIISERDIVNCVVNDKHDFFDKQVKDEMTSNVITCTLDNTTDDIFQMISEKNIRHVPVVENDKLVAMLSIRDLEKVYEITKKQTLTDELTGLYNLSHMNSLLDSEFNQYRRSHSQFSVATILIDDYQNIEVSNSGGTIDNLQVKLADILTTNTRSFDIIGRTADDRFVVTFRNTDRKTAIRACERIRRAVESGISDSVEGLQTVTVSVGLAVANHEDGTGMEILNRSSDLAKKAAATGGNCIELDIEKIYQIAV